MDPKQQLLESLMRDLEAIQLPERYSSAQKEQIMSKRKGQADIDAGRRAISDNEDQYQKALARRGELQTRIGTLSTEIDTAKTKAAQDDPVNQAMQYGKSVGVPVAAYGAGHLWGGRAGAGFDIDPAKRAGDVKGLANTLRGIDKTSPASRAQASAIVHTYDKMPKSRGLGQFGVPALLGGMSLATQAGADYVDDPYLKEGLNIAATAERAGAGGMLFKQVIDTLKNKKAVREAIDQSDVASIESARRQLNESGKFSRVQGPLATPPKVPNAPMGFGLPPAPPQGGMQPAPPPAAPPAPPPAEPTGPTTQRHSERLVAAARAAGASGRLTKESAAEFLTSGVTDMNRKAVGEALGVKPGPNFAKRIAAAVKNFSSTRGASSIALPLAAGAYAASTTESEAGDGTEGASLADKAVAGGAAAGGTAAGQYLISKLPKAIGTAFGAGMPAMAAPQIDSMTDYSPEDLATANNWMAQNLPTWLMPGPARQVHDMAQVPPRNPFRQQNLPYGAMGFGMPPR